MSDSKIGAWLGARQHPAERQRGRVFFSSGVRAGSEAQNSQLWSPGALLMVRHLGGSLARGADAVSARSPTG